MLLSFVVPGCSLKVSVACVTLMLDGSGVLKGTGVREKTVLRGG